jgi:excisionase family DNA binding protein
VDVAGNDEFLTVADVAELLKLNQQTVRNWIDRGDLPAVRIGRRVRIRRSELEAMIDRGYTRGQTQTGAGSGWTAEAFWSGELHPEPVDPHRA